MLKKPTVEIMAKSLTGSYGSDLNSAWLTALPLVRRSSVWPSGSARATVSAARMPPAPGMFSTTTCCPRPSLIFGAMVRVVMSATPPGPNGSTMRTGLVG